MLPYFFFETVLFLTSYFESLKCDCDLSKFEESIVPDIVPYAPEEELMVSYPNNTKVTCGQDIDIAITKEAPSINYTADNLEFYAIVMIDPDAPDPHRPVSAHFLHWLVVNIPGNQVEKGKVLKEYMQPSPPPYSGPHRYIFFAFQQVQYHFSPTFMYGKGRSKFDIDAFKKTLQVTDLVAGNFFYTVNPAHKSKTRRSLLDF